MVKTQNDLVIKTKLSSKQALARRKLLKFQRRVFGFGGAKSGGKAEPLDALVYTPFGPKTMGDVEVGDQVSNPDGTVSRVIATHPQGIKPVYRVTFDDGASCECCLDHLWKVRFSKKPIERWQITATSQLIKELEKGREVFIPTIHGDKEYRELASIKYSRDTECKCITVNHSNGLWGLIMVVSRCGKLVKLDFETPL